LAKFWICEWKLLSLLGQRDAPHTLDETYHMMQAIVYDTLHATCDWLSDRKYY
jgi:hypothetical protein